MKIGRKFFFFPTFHQRRMVSIIPGGGIGHSKSKGSKILLPVISFVGLAF